MTGLYDVHCHILPEVDDGARTLEEALALLKAEFDAGVRQIILTPHYRKGMFEPSPEKIQHAYESLLEHASQLGIRLHLGSEYYVDTEMIEAFKTGRCSTMADSRYVLCEFSEAAEKSFIRGQSYKLLSNGFIPIFAHVERYDVMHKDLNFVAEMVEHGCKMQVNAGSILGRDGRAVKKFCKSLIEYDLVYLIGSDAHDFKKRKPEIGECVEYLKKKMGRVYTGKVFRTHPEEIIAE